MGVRKGLGSQCLAVGPSNLVATKAAKAAFSFQSNCTCPQQVSHPSPWHLSQVLNAGERKSLVLLLGGGSGARLPDALFAFGSVTYRSLLPSCRPYMFPFPGGGVGLGGWRAQLRSFKAANGILGKEQPLGDNCPSGAENCVGGVDRGLTVPQKLSHPLSDR